MYVLGFSLSWPKKQIGWDFQFEGEWAASGAAREGQVGVGEKGEISIIALLGEVVIWGGLKWPSVDFFWTRSNEEISKDPEGSETTI